MSNSYKAIRKCMASVTESYDIVKPGGGTASTPHEAMDLYEKGHRQHDETEIEDILDETDFWIEVTDDKTGVTTEWRPR